MRYEIIKATSAEFNEASQFILDIYNETAMMREELGVQYPEDMAVIRPVGVQGGIIVNKTHHHEEVAMIFFAAFPQEARGKGYLRGCIDAANKWLKKQGSQIRGVELNIDDDREVWHHLGYVHSGTHNLVPCLFNENPMKLFPMETFREGISFEDLVAINPKFLDLFMDDEPTKH
jgi:hypothetical protein